MQLLAGEIHVWMISLAEIFSLKELTNLLDETEHQRSANFHYPTAQQRFLIRHGARRLILSKYLDVQSARLRYSYTEYGKPYVAGTTGISFSASASENLGVLCLSRNPVGIDIEHIKLQFSGDYLDEIIKMHASVDEKVQWTKVPYELKIRSFYTWWTRKEAYVKAMGTGLHMQLDTFTVEIDPRNNPRKSELSLQIRWFPLSNSLLSGYVGNMVSIGEDATVKYFRWDNKEVASCQ